MIEFNGYLTGVAQKRFFQKARALTQNILIFCELIILLISLLIGINTGNYFLVTLNCVMIIVTLLMVRLPKSRKEKKSITPKRIYTDGETIVCVADKYTEAKMISDVKIVKDYGVFYELVFPFGNLSDKFICQKELLTKGTLQEFEELFESKIVVVRQNTRHKTGDGSMS